MNKQAVALVPGFMGFDHRGDRTYFADRFIAGLRAGLEARGVVADVVPVSTLPIGSLAARQACLLRDLATLDAALGTPEWHLVGHSTGGLDAALLARTRRLVDHDGGTRFGDDALVAPRVRSVTTIAAPLRGTSLARAPLAELTHGSVTLAGLKDLVKVIFDVRQHEPAWSRLDFALSGAGSGGLRLVAKMLFGNDLARDLDPAVTTPLIEGERRDVPVFCVATAAPPPRGDDADRLFRALHGFTADHALAPPSPPLTTLDGVRRIESTSTDGATRVPTIELRTNDGVVDTLRQVDGEAIALVIGDHADVIGRYRRVDRLDGQPVDEGLLTSGAEFGDDEFFALIALVAERIASVARA